ncbi:MAG: right-handed parallel beta-helix repeat-containing protein [Pirellulaceae bacterium]
MLQIVDASFCVIRNVLLLGDESAKAGSAIVLRGTCSSCTIDFCRIVNFAESGVRFEGEPKRPMSSNSIRNCHFIGNHWIITGNIFRHNTREALVYDNASQMIVKDNLTD